MSRPRIYSEERIATAIRLPVSLHGELHELAMRNDVSVNLLITRAIADYLRQRAEPAGLQAGEKVQGS